MGEILSPLFFFFLLVDLASGGDNGYWGGSGFLLHLQNQRLQRRHLVSTTPLHLVCVCVCVYLLPLKFYVILSPSLCVDGATPLILIPMRKSSTTSIPRYDVFLLASHCM